MQDDFDKKVGQHHGLERGIKGSKARHTRIKDYYKNLEHSQDSVQITKEDLKAQKVGKKILGISLQMESPEGVAQRLNEQIEPLRELQRENQLLRKTAEQNQTLAKENEKLREQQETLVPDFADSETGKEIYLKELQDFNERKRKEIVTKINSARKAKYQPKKKTKSRSKGWGL